MISEHDLKFATVSQLAGFVNSEWEENRPEALEIVLSVLFTIDNVNNTLQARVLGELYSKLYEIIFIFNWDNENRPAILNELKTRINECREMLTDEYWNYA